MPRYFFKITDGDVVPDMEGLELPDLAAARHAAVDIASECIKGNGEQVWRQGGWQLQVTDEHGLRLTLTLIPKIITSAPDALDDRARDASLAPQALQG